MGCGCGKRFTKSKVNIPTPKSILEEIARRVDQNSKAANTGSQNGAEESSQEAK